MGGATSTLHAQPQPLSRVTWAEAEATRVFTLRSRTAVLAFFVAPASLLVCLATFGGLMRLARRVCRLALTPSVLGCGGSLAPGITADSLYRDPRGLVTCARLNPSSGLYGTLGPEATRSCFALLGVAHAGVFFRGSHPRFSWPTPAWVGGFSCERGLL